MFRTIKIIFLFVVASRTAFSISIECTFDYLSWSSLGSRYCCLAKVTDADNAETLHVEGTHKPGKTNADVEGFEAKFDRSLSRIPSGLENFIGTTENLLFSTQKYWSHFQTWFTSHWASTRSNQLMATYSNTRRTSELFFFWQILSSTLDTTYWRTCLICIMQTLKPTLASTSQQQQVKILERWTQFCRFDVLHWIHQKRQQFPQ